MHTAFHDTIAKVKLALQWLPHWLSAVIILVALACGAMVLHALALYLLRRSRVGRSRIGSLTLSRIAGPSRAAFLTLGVGTAIPALGLDRDTATTLLRLDTAALFLVLGWAGIAFVSLIGDIYVTRLPHGYELDALARKHVTQIRVLRRTLQILLGTLSLAAALMTQPGIQQYGVSLFASAGAAGIVVGLAARPVLTNLLAGIQIAMTQPIKLEDAVIVEGEWGWVEDITSTYVVIRIWDLRRLVVPLGRFLEQPFQNWTRESSTLIGSVLLYVDYTTPIDAVRKHVETIAEQSKLWDRNVVNLQVVDATEKTIQIRVLVSARNAGEAWDLRCEMREKLIAILQKEMPQALPKLRLEDDGRRDPASPRASTRAEAH